MSSRIVLDASALLCLLHDEPGADQVARALPRCVVGALDLAEVVTNLRGRGLSLDEVREALGELHLDVRPLTAAQALVAGDLQASTRHLDLSLGARACLALAIELQGELMTAEADLARTDVGVHVTKVG